MPDSTDDSSTNTSPGGQPRETLALDLLKLANQVSILEEKAKQKIWYKEPAIIISGLAFLLSLVNFGIQQAKERRGERSASLARFQQTLRSVQDLRAECARNLGAMTDPIAKGRVQDTCTNGLFALAGDLESVADTIPLAAFNCDELLTSGDLWLDTQKFKKALDYFSAAGDSPSCDAFHKGVVLREQARAYFAPADIRNVDRARQLFDDAIAHFGARQDPMWEFQVAYTLETWGSFEFALGSKEKARVKLEEARGTYQRLQSEGLDVVLALSRVGDSIARARPRSDQGAVDDKAAPQIGSAAP